MDNHELIQALYKIQAIKFGSFTLKSGVTSKIYIDLRQIISYPHLLNTVANAIWQKIAMLKFDLICGVPYTALPIATCISLQQNIPMIMRRKEKKEHGTKQKIEGAFTKEQRCLIIEDVISSGISILETVEDIREVNLEVCDAVVLINREQGGEENLQVKALVLHSVLTLTEVLESLAQFSDVSRAEQDIIHELL